MVNTHWLLSIQSHKSRLKFHCRTTNLEVQMFKIWQTKGMLILSDGILKNKFNLRLDHCSVQNGCIVSYIYLSTICKFAKPWWWQLAKGYSYTNATGCSAPQLQAWLFWKTQQCCWRPEGFVSSRNKQIHPMMGWLVN